MSHRPCAASRFLMLLAALLFSAPLLAAHIDPVNKYAWAENAGWQNWRDTTVNNFGSVQVYPDHLEGYLWAENIGWIRLGSFSGGGTHSYANTSNADYGINRTGDTLGGYAWSETAGWINFAPAHGGVTLNATTGQFDGYAWGENLGWIHLRSTTAPNYGVTVLTGGAVTLTSSLNPSTVSQSVTFTATVSGTPTPTGTVNFTADGTPITDCTAKALTSGAATCATAGLTVGNRAIAAAYSGDGNYSTSTGNLTQTVNDSAVNGACGSANGQTFSSAPTSGLCSTGTTSSVSGSGPWTWTCTGSNGGSTASCSASFSGGGGGGEVTDDGDGITDATENGAPNGGDGNGDGVSDSQQNNVTSLPVAGGSGSHLTVQTPTGTRLANVTVQTPGQAGVSGNYPWGVLSFEAFGPSPVTITLYLPGRSTVTGLILNKIGGGQTQALNATFSIVQIGGQPVVAVSYSLTDNGPHDTCPASGQICDPVGVAEVTEPPEPPVTLTVTKTGSGTVSSVPAGITCGSDCSENYPVNTAVTLTATAASGYGFIGWSGGCAGTAPTCTLMLSANQTVTATFSAIAPSLLTVVKTGGGTVSSVPAGITCGSDCSESYPANTAVTLTATAASGYGFIGWSGGCAGTAPTCTLTLSATQTVTAIFSSLAPPRVTLGVLRNGQWYLDRSGNSAWDQCGSDGCDAFGQAGDMPVVGNWDGGDRSLLGVLRSGTAQWFLDGNGQWDDCVADACHTFGEIGDLPVAADWSRDGKAKIGVFRAGNWYLDANGNGQWDGCGADRCQSFGQIGDLPVVGDWTGDGIVKVGVFRGGNWYFDNGNGQWDGCGIDRCHLKNPEQPSAGFGLAGDYPIAGDWTGDGVVKMGVYRNGSWFFDNGNGEWDGCGSDACVLRIPGQPNTGFGLPGDLPAVGRW